LSEPARIAITGVGLHSAHGGTDETWAAILHDRSALRCDHAWTLPAAEDFPAAPAADPSPTEFLGDRKMVKYMGPCTQMAVLAAGRALRHAGLLGDEAAPAREAMALFLATGPIAFDVEQALSSFGDEAASDLLALRYEGLGRCHPLMPFKMLLNMPLGLVSITFGIKGQNFILYPGADQGALAMAHAVRGLRRGRFVRALVGGSACSLGLSPLMHLRRAQRLASSEEEAQPFSPLHAGWAPADQAACLVLETEAEAARRSRPVLAYLDEAAVLGPGSVDHLWQTTPSTQAPEALFCTGSANACEVEADRARARLRWTACPPLASGDGVLGVAPAASFVLTTALATLALSNRSLPAALCDKAPAGPLARSWVSFHDQQAAALAVLSGPAEARP
jgi:3-oxoacyl-(acyl-carrier-protein) synthase